MKTPKRPPTRPLDSTRKKQAVNAKPTTAPGAADAKAAPSTKTLSERLKEMGGVEVTSPPDGEGFVITGASGFMRAKKAR